MDQLISLQESCRRLGVAERTMYRYVNAGLIAASRVGGRWKFTQADLDAFVKRNTLAVIEHVVNTEGGEA